MTFFCYKERSWKTGVSDNFLHESLCKFHTLRKIVRLQQPHPLKMVSDRRLPCQEFEPSTTKDPRVGQRCTLNMSRAETSSRWYGVVGEGSASSGVVHVT
ncbi:hypothetical protein TNCV_1270951 [Trichonephila clavipes]|nr:hypothetical protein TNCV_1270951 [Trichonephila clavipes]